MGRIGVQKDSNLKVSLSFWMPEGPTWRNLSLLYGRSVDVTSSGFGGFRFRKCIVSPWPMKKEPNKNTRIKNSLVRWAFPFVS